MKKVTLISIIIFCVAVFGIYGASVVIPSANTQRSDTATADNLDSIIANNTIEHLAPAGNDMNPPNINIENITYQLEQNSNNTITTTEVAQHNTSGDCYLIVNNAVYDVSQYIKYHPGGSGTIIAQCGKEATGLFARIHSNRAWDLLAKYKIGSVDTATADVTSQVLDAIFSSLQKENPQAEVVNVKPKNGFYIAKIILNNRIYEVHINSVGQIIEEEVESDEFDWSSWDEDADDL